MECAVKKAEEEGSPVPDNIFVYMDDCFCSITSRVYMRPGLRSNSSQPDPAESFNQCLNSIHPRVRFTREVEEDGKIAFLDVLAHRQENGQLITQIYRKPTNTNVIIKPHSCHHPAIHITTFKGEMCRINRLCSTQEQIKREVNFLLDVFEDNGHDRTKFEKIANAYVPPHKRRDKTPQNLFSILPFHHDDEFNNSNGNSSSTTSNSNNNSNNDDNVQLRPFATGSST